MSRACALALVAFGLVVIASRPASAQTLDLEPFSTQHLRIHAQRLLPPEGKRPLAHEDEAVDPVVPLRPLLDHLPLQTIQELLRTEERLTTWSFDNYRVKPRVGLHELGIVITRKLPQ